MTIKLYPAAMRTASPVISVWREPEVVPESGATSELLPRFLISPRPRPVASATICTKTVAHPWPMSEAAA